MTSSRHGPHALGFTRATMAGTEGCQAARRSKTQKAGLSWDHSLQLDWVNVEPLVTAGQLYGGEYVTESRTASSPCAESRLQTEALIQLNDSKGLSSMRERGWSPRSGVRA
jgi:hypothetical protein